MKLQNETSMKKLLITLTIGSIAFSGFIASNNIQQTNTHQAPMLANILAPAKNQTFQSAVLGDTDVRGTCTYVVNEIAVTPSPIPVSACSVGSGKDGVCTVTGSVNLTSTSCSGRGSADAPNYSVIENVVSGTSTITLADAPTGLIIDDEVMIINMRGTATDMGTVGAYEIKKVSAITANTITLNSALTTGYNGTTQKIMVQRVPQYSSMTINAGATLTASAWDGTKNGVLAVKVNGELINNGTIDMSAKGYRGGTQGGSDAGGQGGESYCGLGGNGGANNSNGLIGAAGGGDGNAIPASGSKGGNGSCGGGGGSNGSADAAVLLTLQGKGSTTSGGAGGGGSMSSGSGAGAGYGSAGSKNREKATEAGENTSGNGWGGGGAGGTYGSAELSKVYMGSGGGRGGANNTGTGGVGGNGGGIIYIGAKTITAGLIANSGANGGAKTDTSAAVCSGSGGIGGCSGGGGAGSGGSIILNGEVITLSSSTKSLGGTGGIGFLLSAGQQYGGNGGVGRIAAYYSNTLTGESNPIQYKANTCK